MRVFIYILGFEHGEECFDFASNFPKKIIAKNGKQTANNINRKSFPGK